MLKQYHTLEKHCISLELNTKIFQRDTVSSSESALTFAELFETNELKAQIQEKDTVILKLKEKIKSSSADDKQRKVEIQEKDTVILKLKEKIKSSSADDKEGKVERVALVLSASGSQSKDNTKKNRIRRTLKKAKETELEDHPRKVKSSLNKASVVASRASSSVIKKSKSVRKPANRKVWKTTGKVFKTIGYIWTPTGRTFTLVANVCPLTRIATATIVSPREPIPIVQST
nr:hypothetical protein [Tanacetum cinerariifolium]